MLVLLHSDAAAPATLLGLWGPREQPEGPFRRFYPVPSAAEADAEGTILYFAPWRPEWERLVNYLCDMLPYDRWWRSAEVAEGVPFSAVFDDLAAQLLGSVAAVHSAGTPAPGKYAVKMLTADQEAYHLATTPGQAVAAALGVPTGGPKSGHRLSSLLEWFSDDDRLLVVAPDPNRPEGVDLALAHGLAYRGDRDLWLAVPEGMEGPTLRRAAFLEPSIRVWTHSEWTPTEQIVPARAELLALLNAPVAGSADYLDDRAEWIAPLLAWSASAPGVVMAPTGRYLGFHYNGHMVLKIRPNPSWLVVSAGVHHPKAEGLLTAAIDRQMVAAMVPLFIDAAADACTRYQAVQDTVNADQQLQSKLTPDSLGLITMRRAFPARRPAFYGLNPSIGGDKPGFIDYLGVDLKGSLHVVAVKVGGGTAMVLEGLDYWTWAMAHREQLAEQFDLDLDTIEQVCLDFVVAPKPPSDRPVGPYTAGQAEALLGEIPWRFHLATTRPDGSVDIARLPSRTVPDGSPRRSQPDWAHRLGDHLAGHAAAEGHVLRAGVFYPSNADGLSVAAQAAHAALVELGLDHRMVGHVRSSQAFALNLFAGLDQRGRLAVLRRLGVWATACEPPSFEVSDAADRLREKTTASPHATQVDVVLRATDDDGKRYIALIEVKLSETDFGHCSAYQSERNPNRNACRQPNPFGGDPSGCFQLRNHDRGAPRRYNQALGPLTSQPSGNGCWWRQGANQPMRNVALAKVWLNAGEADTAVVALCAPLAHRAIWRRWSEARAFLDADPAVPLGSLPADCVTQYLIDGPILARRYLLDEPAAVRMSEVRRWQSRLDGLFPAGAALQVGGDTDAEAFWPYVVRRPLVTDVIADKPAIRLNPTDGPFQPGTWELDTPEPVIYSTPKGARLQLAPQPGERWLIDPALVPPAVWTNRRPPVLNPTDEPDPELDFIPPGYRV